MKKTLLFICGLLLSIPAMADDFESAQDAVKNMGVGWNLGNTLDANDASKTWTTTEQHETCWGQPVTKPELLRMMKEAGFSAIRVPVTWYQEMDNDGKVNEAWMNRVKEVVDYVISNGMYCILNVHHDTGDGSTHWLHASMDIYNTQKARYENLWKQIAERFKDYDDHLLFEGYNEMLDKYNSWCFATFNTSSRYIADDAADAYKAINSYAQSFVDVVRATGGNNAQRNLIVSTYGACCGSGSWNAHLKDPLTEMALPADAASNHLIFEVHNYPSIANGLNSAKSELDACINDLNTYLVSKGAPVIFGEWGTSNVDNGSDYIDRHDTMVAFLDYFARKCKDNNIATFYWMGLTDGVARTLPAFNQPDLAETIVKAYYGDSFTGKYPTEDNFQTTYTVTYNSRWGELFLYGDWSSSSPQKLSEYKGIRVELDNDYSGKLQVKVYGDKNGKNDDGSDKYKEQYAPLTSGAKTTTVNFNSATLGSSFYRITLQTDVAPCTAKVMKAMLIKSDGSEVAGKVSIGWGCTLTSESTPITGLQPVVARDHTVSPAIYTLSGQRTSAPRKGIYISNGRKYIAK